MTTTVVIILLWLLVVFYLCKVAVKDDDQGHPAAGGGEPFRTTEFRINSGAYQYFGYINKENHSLTVKFVRTSVLPYLHHTGTQFKYFWRVTQLASQIDHIRPGSTTHYLGQRRLTRLHTG